MSSIDDNYQSNSSYQSPTASKIESSLTPLISLVSQTQDNCNIPPIHTKPSHKKSPSSQLDT